MGVVSTDEITPASLAKSYRRRRNVFAAATLLSVAGLIAAPVYHLTDTPGPQPPASVVRLHEITREAQTCLHGASSPASIDACLADARADLVAFNGAYPGFATQDAAYRKALAAHDTVFVRSFTQDLLGLGFLVPFAVFYFAALVSGQKLYDLTRPSVEHSATS